MEAHDDGEKYKQRMEELKQRYDEIAEEYETTLETNKPISMLFVDLKKYKIKYSRLTIAYLDAFVNSQIALTSVILEPTLQEKHYQQLVDIFIQVVIKYGYVPTVRCSVLMDNIYEKYPTLFQTYEFYRCLRLYEGRGFYFFRSIVDKQLNAHAFPFECCNNNKLMEYACSYNLLHVAIHLNNQRTIPIYPSMIIAILHKFCDTSGIVQLQLEMFCWMFNIACKTIKSQFWKINELCRLLTQHNDIAKVQYAFQYLEFQSLQEPHVRRNTIMRCFVDACQGLHLEMAKLLYGWYPNVHPYNSVQEMILNTRVFHWICTYFRMEIVKTNGSETCVSKIRNTIQLLDWICERVNSQHLVYHNIFEIYYTYSFQAVPFLRYSMYRLKFDKRRCMIQQPEDCCICKIKTTDCILNCNHMFCETCIEDNILNYSKSNCPLCRQLIVSIRRCIILEEEDLIELGPQLKKHALATA